MRRSLGLLAGILLAAAVPLAAQENGSLQHVTVGLPPGLPFSSAVRAGDLIFLSGQLGNVPGKAELVPGGIEAETRQTMENIGRVLEASGSSFDRVVRCTVYLADMSEWSRMNAVYATFFPGAKPARTAAGATGLALGARVEIECVAAAR